jgi:hypothetical protein
MSCHPHAQQLICHNRDCALAGQVQASLGCFNRHIGDYHAPISRRTCNLAKCTSRGKVFDAPSDMFVHELEPVHRENPNPEPITNWICQVPGCPKFGIPFLKYESYLDHFNRTKGCGRQNDARDVICTDSGCVSFNTEFKCLRLWSEHMFVCPISLSPQAAIEDQRTCKDQTCQAYNKPFVRMSTTIRMSTTWRRATRRGCQPRPTPGMYKNRSW